MAGFWRPRRLRKLRGGLVYLGVLLLGMLISAFGITFLLAGEIYEYSDTVDGVHLPPVDAIVCLAGGRGRIAASGDIWYRYWELYHPPEIREPAEHAPNTSVPVLYISGMGQKSSWGTLVRNVRPGVRDVIRPQDVLLETESINTEGNAELLISNAQSRHWSRVLLMTSPYHMRRSRLIFENVARARGVPLRIETLSIYQEPFEPGEWRGNLHGIHVTMSEYLKWAWYRAMWRPKG